MNWEVTPVGDVPEETVFNLPPMVPTARTCAASAGMQQG